MLKILRSNFFSYPQYFYLILDFYDKTGIRFSLRDKRLFEITEVEITKVDCVKYASQDHPAHINSLFRIILTLPNHRTLTLHPWNPYKAPDAFI